MTKTGRPSPFDDKKKADVVRLLAAGCSLAVAARYVGCSTRTISRHVKKDADFAQKLRRARLDAEVFLIDRLRGAAEDDRYWRAGAWLLERTSPQRYGARRPDVITVEQIGDLMTRLLDAIDSEVPAEYRQALHRRLRALMTSLKRKRRRKPSGKAVWPPNHLEPGGTTNEAATPPLLEATTPIEAGSSNESV